MSTKLWTRCSRNRPRSTSRCRGCLCGGSWKSRESLANAKLCWRKWTSWQMSSRVAKVGARRGPTKTASYSSSKTASKRSKLSGGELPPVRLRRALGMGETAGNRVLRWRVKRSLKERHRRSPKNDGRQSADAVQATSGPVDGGVALVGVAAVVVVVAEAVVAAEAGEGVDRGVIHGKGEGVTGRDAKDRVGGTVAGIAGRGRKVGVEGAGTAVDNEMCHSLSKLCTNMRVPVCVYLALFQLKSKAGHISSRPPDDGNGGAMPTNKLPAHAQP